MAINDHTPSGLFCSAWDHSYQLISRSSAALTGRKKKLSVILELALESWDIRVAAGRSAYLCMSLINAWEKGKINGAECDYAKNEISKKINFHSTLRCYLAETMPFPDSNGVNESFEARNPMDVSHAEQRKFWKDWIEELKEKGE